MQCREKSTTDGDENPAEVYRCQVLAHLPDHDARREPEQADAVRSTKKIDTCLGGRSFLACFEEDRVPI